jgi:hypothetical protein
MLSGTTGKSHVSFNFEIFFIEYHREYYVWIRGSVYAEMRSTTRQFQKETCMGRNVAAAVTVTVLFVAIHLSPSFAQQAPLKLPQKAEPAKTTAPQPATKAQSSPAQPVRIDPSAVSLFGTVDLKTENPIKLPTSVSAAILDNGYVVRAWESLDPGDRMIGTAALFTESLQPASAVVPYTDRWKDDLIAYNTALPFANGNILLVYIDRRDQKGKFVLYDSRMKIIKGPVVFSPKNAHRFSAVRLPGGMSTLIAFYEPGRPASDALWDHESGYCLFTVVNAEGAIVSQPKAFTRKGHIKQLTVTLLSGGLIFTAYEFSGGASSVIDQTGNILRQEKEFYGGKFSDLSAVTLADGNVMVIFLDDKGMPRASVIDYAGNVVSTQNLPVASVANLCPTRLSNGNVLVVMAPNNGLTAVILNPAAKIVKGPTTFFGEYNFGEYNDYRSRISVTPFRNEMALVLYSGNQPKSGGKSKIGFSLLK